MGLAHSPADLDPAYMAESRKRDDAGLRPIMLFEQPSVSKERGVTPGQLSDSGSPPQEV